MPGIWLLADSRQLTLELIRVGRQLADEMKTSLTVFLYSERESAAAYFACGAEEVVFLPTVNEGQTMDDYVPDIAEEISRGDPDVFLVGGSARGREMAARIAARLQIGLCSDCIAMTYNLEKTRLEMQRLMYGGAAIQTVTSSLRPQMATIPAKTYAPAE
ncbi:MAG: electron transfer flavoprotein subunit alpha/FixB family protein, partial [Ignavibacteriales bacterium]